MVNRMSCGRTIVALACICDVSVCVAQSGAVPPTDARVGATPALVTLVREAVPRNLTIEAARFTPDIAEAEIQAARGAFDAQFQLQPAFGHSRETVVTPAGSFDTSISTTTLNGGAGGLLPYSAVSVVGNLPTGTQYGLSLQSAHESLPSRSVAAGQNYPGFDTTLTLSVSHSLLRGAGAAIARAGIRSATLDTESSRAGFGRVIETTVAQVEDAYWTAVYARALERVAEESVARAQTLLERNEQMLALQLVANIDVLTARQAVAARTATLTEARQARADAADAVVFVVYGRDADAHLDDDL